MSDELRAIGQRWALQSDTTKEFQAEVASTAALLRIADALERIADAMTAAAPSDEYERGRAAERADVLRFLRHEADAQAEPYGGEALSDAVAWIDRGDHLGATP